MNQISLLCSRHIITKMVQIEKMSGRGSKRKSDASPSDDANTTASAASGVPPPLPEEKEEDPDAGRTDKPTPLPTTTTTSNGSNGSNDPAPTASASASTVAATTDVTISAAAGASPPAPTTVDGAAKDGARKRVRSVLRFFFVEILPKHTATDFRACLMDGWWFGDLAVCSKSGWDSTPAPAPTTTVTAPTATPIAPTVTPTPAAGINALAGTCRSPDRQIACNIERLAQSEISLVSVYWLVCCDVIRSAQQLLAQLASKLPGAAPTLSSAFGANQLVLQQVTNRLFLVCRLWCVVVSCCVLCCHIV